MISDHRQLAQLIDDFFLILKHDLEYVKFVLNVFDLFKQTDLLCYLKRVVLYLGHILICCVFVLRAPLVL